MVDKKILKLINEQFDHEISAMEEKRLRQRLENDAAAREYQNQLHQTADILKQLHDLEPPSYLKTQVMNAVRAKSSQSCARAGWFSKIVSVLEVAVRRRPSLVFATGLLLGIVIYAGLVDQFEHQLVPTQSDLSGTLVLTDNDKALKVTQSFPIVADGVTGSVQVKCAENLSLLDVHLVPSRPLSVEFGYPPGERTFVALKKLDDSAPSLRLLADTVRISIAKETHYLLVFHDVVASPGPISFKILVAGMVSGQNLGTCANQP